MFKYLRFLLTLSIIIIPQLLNGFIDNRFLDPYLQYTGHMQRRNTSFYLAVQPFILTAHSSFGNNDEEHQPLFSLYGPFNQIALDQALFKEDKITKSLIPQEFINAAFLQWFMNGHLEVFGVSTSYYHLLSKHISWGFYWALMHANSRMEMIFNNEACKQPLISETNIQELLFSKEKMINLLNIQPGLWQKTSLSDLDIFLRIGAVCDYKYRFQRIDAGVRIGLLVPTAAARNIYNPASIPLGGNKHWGMYGMISADFGLKEDLSTGFFLQISKRFPRSFCDRLPLLNENPLFGTLIETVRVDPGVTVGFAPYIIFEDLRDGLGFRAAYKIVGHAPDCFISKGEFSEVLFNEPLVRSTSSWSLEHVMISLFYDFAKNKEIRGATPTLSLVWDIPVQFFTSRRAFRTHGISLLLETEF